MISPSAPFARSVAANVAYWRQRTQQIGGDGLAALDRDRRNLFRAAEFGLTLPQTWPAAAELILQAFPLIQWRGYWQEWIPVLDHALQRCDPGDRELQGRLLDNLGIMYRHCGRLQQAVAMHQQEARLGQASGDDWRLAHAYLNLGEALRMMRRYRDAEQYGQLALDHFRAIDPPVVKFAFVFQHLGQVAQGRGQWLQAADFFQEAIAIWRQVNNPANVADVMQLLGYVLAAAGHYETAEQVYQEALPLVTDPALALLRCRILNGMGVLYFRQARFEEALLRFGQAGTRELRLSSQFELHAMIVNNVGNAQLALGQLDEARHALQQAAVLWRRLEDPANLGNTLGTLGDVEAARGDSAAAQKHYDEALLLLGRCPEDAWAQRLYREFDGKRAGLEPGPAR